MAKKVTNKKENSVRVAWTEIWCVVLWFVVFDAIYIASSDLVSSGALSKEWHVNLFILCWFMFGAVSYWAASWFDKRRKQDKK